MSSFDQRYQQWHPSGDMLWQLRLLFVVWTKLWHNHRWLRRLQYL